jgi:hypothetical protein
VATRYDKHDFIYQATIDVTSPLCWCSFARPYIGDTATKLIAFTHQRS